MLVLALPEVPLTTFPGLVATVWVPPAPTTVTKPENAGLSLVVAVDTGLNVPAINDEGGEMAGVETVCDGAVA